MLTDKQKRQLEARLNRRREEARAHDAPPVEGETQDRNVIGDFIETRVLPDTFDEANRTVEMVFASETPVLRQDWDGPFYEVLEISEKAIDLTRFRSGAPLLDTHDRWSGLASQLGVVDGARIEGKQLVGPIRFSRRQEVEGYFQDVKDKIIRSGSVGYGIRDMVLEKEVDGVPTYRVTRWEPYELSLVPIPADVTAQTRSLQHQPPTARVAPQQEKDMTEEERRAAEEKRIREENEQRNQEAIRKATEEATRAATEAANKRAIEIRSAVRAAGLPETEADSMIADSSLTVDAARAKVITRMAEERAKTPAPGAGRITIDERDNLRSGLENALLFRAHPGVEKFKLNENGRRFAGMTMMEMVRESLRAAGIDTQGLSKMALAARAFESTSDFTYITADVMGKSLRAQYEAAPQTFKPWARRTSLPDFKIAKRIQLGDAPQLELVNEAGEFKYGALGDQQEGYRLFTYGKILAFTRQLLINDDMDALTRVPGLFGRAVADLESDIVYNTLLANAVMADGQPLFSAAHGNLAATGGAINIANMDAARKAMRTQKNLQGRFINVAPKYLLVGPAQETAARQFVNTDYVPTQQSNINVFTDLIVIVEPRITDNRWYVLADYNQIDTFEYAFLEGQEGVYTETENGFDVDGMRMKARHDFAAKAIEFRGVYMNPGQ